MLVLDDEDHVEPGENRRLEVDVLLVSEQNIDKPVDQRGEEGRGDGGGGGRGLREERRVGRRGKKGGGKYGFYSGERLKKGGRSSPGVFMSS